MTNTPDNMPSAVGALLLSIALLSSPVVIRAQELSPVTANHPSEMKTLVVAAEAQSNSVVAVPPITSVTFNLRSGKQASSADAVDLPSLIKKEAALNGLQSSALLPWHIVITYDQFDEDGDNVHSGVYEEYWVGPKRYKRIYRSDNFNQTDYATDKGLYRRGDQRWPDGAESRIRTEVLAPFSYAATLQGFHATKVDRTFSGYKLQCVLIEKDSSISDPIQYCFEPNSSILRYSHGLAWLQTVYNQISPFQGRSLAHEVDVTDGGKPYLKLRVDTIELISHVDETDFSPPPDALGPLEGKISGVHQEPINISNLPRWPDSLSAQRFTVKVEIVIGKNGRVISARAVSGPPKGFKACQDAVRKWIFKPYLVLDKPVEVEQTVECSNN